ncbi:hypothetical protein [Caballeronia sp. LZ028]|uniref:hypothetical protein n=1 Tax=Caballeronia sp. LZ028 TaxID=3038563 RepID=UPI0028635A1E|nr:hypothetical protein [Caballeronia sp. LZ028]MDR5765001.1 hypothetical protein [Caballeronia sp. LZ028]
MTEELKCTCKGVLGHSRQCAMFDESMMEPKAHAAGASEGQAVRYVIDEQSALGQSLKHIERQDAEIAALRERIAGMEKDAERLDWLREESCDLRCIDVPTGGDDSDVRWIVVQHHMSAPHERELARSTTDEPRDAVDAAMAPEKR